MSGSCLSAAHNVVAVHAAQRKIYQNYVGVLVGEDFKGLLAVVCLQYLEVFLFEQSLEQSQCSGSVFDDENSVLHEGLSFLTICLFEY